MASPDPKREFAVEVVRRLKEEGFQVISAANGRDGIRMAKELKPSIITLDVLMPGMDGFEVLQRLNDGDYGIPVIVISGHADIQTAVEAVKSGAYDYLIKPLDFDVLQLTIERACEHAGLKEENRTLKEHLQSEYDIANIIGRSQPIKKLLDMMSNRWKCLLSKRVSGKIRKFLNSN